MSPATALRLVKLLHTLVWALFAGSIVAIPLAAAAGQLALAWGLVAFVFLEVAVLLANRMKCPLTTVAERYTSERQDNFDIYLPRWLARHNKAVFGGLYVAGIAGTAWVSWGVAGMADELLRILSLCVALASVETLHGVFRAAVLVPRIGKQRALKVGIVTGSALAFGVCYLLVPGIGVDDAAGLLGIGLVLALFMAGFDIALARLLLRQPWARVARDFDPRSGNYLSLGLVLLVLFPWAVMRFH